MSDSDKEVMELLRNQNIPAYVWPKTLVDERQQDLHDWVEQGEYSDDLAGGMENTFFYPNAPKDSGYARTIANLVGKEMVLMGDDAYITSMGTISSLFATKKIPEEKADRLYNALVLIITNFYDHGAAFPLTPWIAYRTRQFILDRLYKTDQAIILLGDKKLSACTEWWPESFLAEIDAKVTNIPLTQPPQKKGK